MKYIDLNCSRIVLVIVPILKTRILVSNMGYQPFNAIYRVHPMSIYNYLYVGFTQR